MVSSHVLVLVLERVLRVEPALDRPVKVAERGLVLLEPAVTGTSAAATIIPIETKAWTSSSCRWNCGQKWMSNKHEGKHYSIQIYTDT